MGPARSSRWQPAGTASRRSARPTGAWIRRLAPNSCASCRRDAVAGLAAALHHELAAPLGREHDRAAHAALRPRAGGADVQPGNQLPEDDLHLHLSEARAEAAAHAAAERDPGVRAGRVLQEALRAEGARVLVDVWAPVDQVDARDDLHTRGEQAATDLHRLREL